MLQAAPGIRPVAIFAIAQAVKQFDDGEGLLWRPIGWDFAGNGQRQTI
jgi:hypothetical protein